MAKPKSRFKHDMQAVMVRGKAVPKEYLRLQERFRLRPITNDQELEEAGVVVDELFDQEELRPAEEEYLDVLCGLVEAYETEHYAISDVSSARVLRFLIEQRGVTQQRVSTETGIANSTISAILKGDREMSRKHIEAFARYFGAEPAVFLPGNDTISHSAPTMRAGRRPQPKGRVRAKAAK